MLEFAFAGSPLDRASSERAKPERMATFKASSEARFVKVAGDAAVIRDGRIETSRPEDDANAIFPRNCT